MTKFFNKTKIYIASLFFPSTKNIKELENLEADKIEKTLPKSADSPHPFVLSVFRYKNDNVKEAIKAIKYKGNIFLVASFGEILFKEISDFLETNKISADNIYIVPIPLSKKRYAQRGFNQSELIAKAVIKNDRQKIFIYSPHFLRKDKHTDPQTKLSMSRRRVNIKNCFSVPYKERPNIQNKTIILIDDVATTGSTLKEARKTLLEAKAKEVYAFTLAH
ncbi:MAG: ComF family protein [Patescibacteria group bacterium]